MSFSREFPAQKVNFCEARHCHSTVTSPKCLHIASAAPDTGALVVDSQTTPVTLAAPDSPRIVLQAALAVTQKKETSTRGIDSF